jgi:hypothetical protein
VGYFAVLRQDGAALPGIRRCHVNVWSLSSLLPGRRLLYFDVGLELVAGAEQVSEVELMLPFRVEEGHWPGGARTAQDLYATITNRDVAELVFGGPVDFDQHGDDTFLGIGDYEEPLKLARVRPSGIKRNEDEIQRSDSSVYKVPLDVPIPAAESRYVRLRWRVFGAAPLWSWKRLNGGARFDFRVCDVRESRFADADHHLRQRMIPIDEINVFLIAPAKYQIATTSPEAKYLRILEAGAWRDYLSGAAYLTLRSEMLVYYWREKPAGRHVENAATTSPGTPISATGSTAGTSAAESATATPAPSPDPPTPAPSPDPTPAPVPSGAVDATQDSGATSGSTPTAGANRPRQSINADNPFRVFADLNRTVSTVWWAEIAKVFAALVLALLVFRVTSGSFNLSRVHWGTWLTLIGGTTFVSVLGLLERARRWASAKFMGPRLWLREVERRILLINKK